MKVKVGTFPCTFRSDQPHPVGSIEARRLARFRRHIEGGIRYQEKGGATVYFLTLAMRYDRSTGHLKGDLRYSTQRFIQILRRKGLSIEYLRVIESTAQGAKNHAHLVLAVKGELPPEHDLKDVWSRATYGTSFEVKNIRANQDIGWLSRYLSKALGSYLMKNQFPEGSEATGGLDGSYHNATVKNHVSTSRGWLPVGAEAEWKHLFRKNAFFWMCDRGFYHTDLGKTTSKWLNWIDRQAWSSI